MADRHVWLSKETESLLDELQSKWGLSRSAAIAKAVMMAREQERHG